MSTPPPVSLQATTQRLWALMRPDERVSFVEFARNFDANLIEITVESAESLRGTVRGWPYPMQVIWVFKSGLVCTLERRLEAQRRRKLSDREFTDIFRGLALLLNELADYGEDDEDESEEMGQ